MNKRYDLPYQPCVVSCPLHSLAIGAQSYFTAHMSASATRSSGVKMPAVLQVALLWV